MSSQPDFPYTFDPDACQSCGGKCCRWGGYVWVSEADILAMSQIMNLDLDAFAEEYLRASYGKISLQERLWEGESICSLFDPYNGHCLVYHSRPEQCRSFPFWEVYRSDYRQLMKICPGVRVQEFK